jgi:Kdo2-lipid IVA lauroyltransferase/acyltransferase
MVILPLSVLPFPVLYLISDGLYIFIYKVAGYRKKVVMQNLRNSLPGKSEQELKGICSKFYRHLCDLIVESLKLFTISSRQVNKRFKLLNPEIFQPYFEQNKSLILIGGHINNWELFAVAIPALIPHKAMAIYQPLTNKFFNDRMLKSRSRYGLSMMSVKDVRRVFEEQQGNITATVFAADQSPSNPARAYWTEFLHQDTAVFTGAERYARMYGYPVLYGVMQKVKRGYYTVRFSVVANDPAHTADNEITERFTRILELDILSAPQYWLWSHRRWKHKRPATV